MGLLNRFARQWVAGETVGDAFRGAREANRRGMGAILNLLGEHYHDRGLVAGTVREYAEMIRGMREAGIRGCVSIKASQLGIDIDPAWCLENVVGIVDLVREDGGVLWLDMEGSAYTDRTLDLYERLLSRYGRVGVCLQANLRRTAADLERLLAVGARIRLCKGAYREPGAIAYLSRPEVDRNYLKLEEVLFSQGNHFAVASHDGPMIDRALDLQKTRPKEFEFQMLMGVRDPLKSKLVGGGHRVLEYIPYGPNWLPYFLRRLRERPRNVVTMARSFVSG